METIFRYNNCISHKQKISPSTLSGYFYKRNTFRLLHQVCPLFHSYSGVQYADAIDFFRNRY